MVWQCLTLCCHCSWHLVPSGITPLGNGSRDLSFPPALLFPVFPGSQLWHTAGTGLVLPLFPELLGPLRNAVLALELCAPSKWKLPSRSAAFWHGVAQENASLPWDPWDLAQSLEEDLICKLQERGGFNLQVKHVIGSADIGETRPPSRLGANTAARV